MRHTQSILMVLGMAAAATLAPTFASAQEALSQHTEAVQVPVETVKDQLLLNAAAGATLNSGNTRAYAGNVGGRVYLVRYPSQLTIEALGTLGYARNSSTGDLEKNSANVIGRARYDRFLSRMDALFVAVQPRNDRFAGIDIRLQNQIGYLRNLFYPSDSHRFWTEVGYDFTYDNFSRVTVTGTEDVSGLIAAPMPGSTYTRTFSSETNPKDDYVHSGRLFFGYTNSLFAAAQLNLGLETLFDVEDQKNLRMTGVAEINSSVSKRFKLGVQSRTLFDNQPVDGKKKTDSVIAVQLVYTFDSLADQAAATACPACDCTSEVSAARAECASESAVSPTLAPDAPEAAPQPLPSEAAPAPSEPAEVQAPAAQPVP